MGGDRCNRPLNTYGRTKLKGEDALAQTGATYMIFRTSWVYGATGKNFFRTILRVARERESMNIVADQFGAPGRSKGSRDCTNQQARR